MVLVSILLVSCVSSSKLLQEGRYDDAIVKAIKKLRKAPTDRNETAVLRKALKLANKNDIESIQSLKLSGQPSIWESVYQHYLNLNQRQEMISRLPDGILNKINYKPHNYVNDLAFAKRKAADYLDAKGMLLLNKENRFDARSAWKYFQRESKLFPDKPGLKSKLNTAQQQGISRVLFMVKNSSRQNLPKDFKDEFNRINFSYLNRKWLHFSTQFSTNRDIDYVVSLNIRNILVSPGLIDRASHREEKTIEDGWQYVLDKRGNVKKDSAGNDIKIKKYRTIHCEITQVHLTKSVQINGTLDYFDNHSQQLIKSRPISSQFIFDYQFATARGDVQAASEKSKVLLHNPQLPFPADLKMIFDASRELKQIALSYIRQDRRLFR